MMKLIDKHRQWVEQGYITNKNGLCQHFVEEEYIELFSLFKPERASAYGTKTAKTATYWGYHPDFTSYKEDELFEKLTRKGENPYTFVGGKYSAFRQTIVLLICAMNNEL